MLTTINKQITQIRNSLKFVIRWKIYEKKNSSRELENEYDI